MLRWRCGHWHNHLYGSIVAFWFIFCCVCACLLSLCFLLNSLQFLGWTSIWPPEICDSKRKRNIFFWVGFNELEKSGKVFILNIIVNSGKRLCGHVGRFFFFLSISMCHIHTSVCSNFARFFFFPNMLGSKWFMSVSVSARQRARVSVCSHEFTVCRKFMCKIWVHSNSSNVSILWFRLMKKNTQLDACLISFYTHTHFSVHLSGVFFSSLNNQSLNFWIEHIFFCFVVKNGNTIEFFLHTF